MSKVKAYIHLDMYEKDGDVHINSAGNGNPEDLVLLISYLLKDQPDLVKIAQDKVLCDKINEELQ